MANVKLTPEVTAVLQRSGITGNLLILPPEKLDRKFYEEVAKAITAAGGKWNRSKQGFVFDSSPKEKLGLSLESGVVIDEKKERQAFYTPSVIAEEIALIANVHGLKVLEPSAGGGALAKACLKFGAERVCCIEKEPSCFDVLANISEFVTIGDFLLMKPGVAYSLFDRVVMNPPFTKGQDVKHIAKALEWLKPGGILYSIVPATKNPKLDALGASFIKEFPAKSFKESGTNVATWLIAISK